ncbi:hypothetical protein BH09BAC1_BH09BAC1_28870 [soil metagenome]
MFSNFILMQSQTETLRIINQINRLYQGNCWLGSNLTEILGGIPPSQANAIALGFNNTMHQIVRHILATELVVLERLKGNDYVLTPEEDWVPKAEIEKLDWEATIRELFESKDVLIRALTHLQDEMLDRAIIKDYSSIYVTLHGHIQHTIYHMGQIMVLKRIL